MPGSTSDPCGIRSSLWRCLALVMAAPRPIHGGTIYKAIWAKGVGPASSTVYQALHEMADAGLLERGVDNGSGKEKTFAITQKGLDVVALVRNDLVELVELIDGQAAPVRPATQPQEHDVLQALLAVARASEAAVAELREAMRRMQRIVDETLMASAPT